MTSSNSLYSRFNAVNAGVLFLMLVTDVASLITTPTRTTSTALRLSSEVVTAEAAEKSSESSSSSNSFVKPPRLIPDDPSLIPSLYNYDHCPFCVRVRLALGFKNIKHNLVFMANDDIHTPTAMVGKKIAPIMVSPQCIDIVIRT